MRIRPFNYLIVVSKIYLNQASKINTNKTNKLIKLILSKLNLSIFILLAKEYLKCYDQVVEIFLRLPDTHTETGIPK